MKGLRKSETFRSLLAILCAAAIARAGAPAYAPQETARPPSTTQESPNDGAKIPADQLDSLVAPIALYPDPLLAQVLAASTYPLEIVLLQRWLETNKNLKDKQLADEVAKQSWDPSVQALAGLPDLAKQLSDNIQWTTDLGNAFLAQQSDVMDAVQRMRAKASAKGTLQTTEQQKVETEVVDNKSAIVIEQADPEVVYVPSYDPVMVYGPGYYPYMPYPAWHAGAAAISFGVGIAMGAFWGGGWGWGCGWGHNDININMNNNFNRNSNFNRNNVSNRAGGSNAWQHNPQHRGGAPYGDRATSDKFNRSARGDSSTQRQGGDRAGSSGSADRAAGSGVNRGGDSSVRSEPRGADGIGSRDVSRDTGGKDAFGGGSRGFDGPSARSSSQRGSSSMSRGGGGFGGGGSRGGGGGSRGGGGRRR